MKERSLYRSVRSYLARKGGWVYRFPDLPFRRLRWSARPRVDFLWVRRGAAVFVEVKLRRTVRKGWDVNAHVPEMQRKFLQWLGDVTGAPVRIFVYQPRRRATDGGPSEVWEWCRADRKWVKD